MGYLRPTDGYTLSSHAAHKRRNPPSQEAGTDIWAEFGTPLRAPADGVVVEVGGNIYAATGYFVTIDLDDGRRIRFLHLWDRYVFRGQRVSRGTVFAQSGGSGYGSMTAAGGAGTVGRHVHVTLWPSHSYSFGTNANTLDFEQHADPIGSAALSESDPIQSEEDDMFDDAAKETARLRHEDLMKALGKIHQAAAPFRQFQYGTGIVVWNPETGRIWILPEGYGDLLNKLQVTAGAPIPVDGNQLSFATGFLPDAIGELQSHPATAELGDGDLAAIKDVIAQAHVAVTPDQLKKMIDAVGAAARTGGEQGAVKALKDVTFVVSAA